MVTIALAQGPGDALEGLVGHLHVVAPQGGGRAQHGDVGSGHRTEVQRCMVGLLVGQLAAPPGGGDEHADQDGDSHEDHDNGHIQIVPRLMRDVASTRQQGRAWRN